MSNQEIESLRDSLQSCINLLNATLYEAEDHPKVKRAEMVLKSSAGELPTGYTFDIHKWNGDIYLLHQGVMMRTEKGVPKNFHADRFSACLYAWQQAAEGEHLE